MIAFWGLSARGMRRAWPRAPAREKPLPDARARACVRAERQGPTQGRL